MMVNFLQLEGDQITDEGHKYLWAAAVNMTKSDQSTWSHVCEEHEHRIEMTSNQQVYTLGTLTGYVFNATIEEGSSKTSCSFMVRVGVDTPSARMGHISMPLLRKVLQIADQKPLKPEQPVYN